MRRAAQAHAPALQCASRKETTMTRTRPFLIEAAAQIVLAAAVGLFVSIVLAGTTLLLAA